jgi:hypothetical protein
VAGGEVDYRQEVFVGKFLALVHVGVDQRRDGAVAAL